MAQIFQAFKAPAVLIWIEGRHHNTCKNPDLSYLTRCCQAELIK